MQYNVYQDKKILELSVLYIFLMKFLLDMTVQLYIAANHLKKGSNIRNAIQYLYYSDNQLPIVIMPFETVSSLRFGFFINLYNQYSLSFILTLSFSYNTQFLKYN